MIGYSNQILWSYGLYSKQRGPRSGSTLHNKFDYRRKKIAFLHADA